MNRHYSPQEDRIRGLVEDRQHFGELKLFELIGNQVITTGHQHAEGPDEANGKSWFADNYQKIQSTVCGDPRVQRALNATQAVEDANLVILVATVLSSSFTPLAASLVALLICRRGLSALCNGFCDARTNGD